MSNRNTRSGFFSAAIRPKLELSKRDSGFSAGSTIGDLGRTNNLNQ